MPIVESKPTDPIARWQSWYGVPWGLLALHAVLSWMGRAPGLLTRQDDSRYLGLAAAIRQGQYRDIMWPDAPLHHMYPPGYPSVLAIWTAIGGSQFDWLITLHVLLSVAAIALAFDFTRRRFPPLVALGSLIVLALSPRLIEYAGQVASEGALALCICLAVWASVALKPGPRQLGVILIAGLLAPTMRAAGVVIPIAVVGWLLSERRWRDASIAALLGAMVLGPLMWWILNDPLQVAGSSYAADIAVPAGRPVGPVQRIVERMGSHALFYVQRGVPSVLGAPVIEGTIVDNILWTIVIFGGLLFGALVAWKRLRLAVWVLAAMGGLMLVWPWQVTRYLIPVLPLLVPLILMGLWQAVLRRPTALTHQRAATATVGAVTALLAVQGGALAATRIRDVAVCSRSGDLPDPQCMSAEQRGFFLASKYVRDSLPATVRVLSAKSEPLYTFTGRVTVPFQQYTDKPKAQLLNQLLARGTEYVLLSDLHRSERWSLAPFLLAECGRLTLVRAFTPRSLLFRIQPDSATTLASAASKPDLSMQTPKVHSSPSCRALESFVAAPGALEAPSEDR